MGLRAPEPERFYIRWQNRMSYINEALKKAQKDKDANHMSYMHSIGKYGSIKHSFDKRFFYLFFIIIILAALLIYYKFGRHEEPSLVNKKEIIVDMSTADNDKRNNGSPVKNKQDQKAANEIKKNSREEEIVNHREARYTQAASFLKDGNLKEAEGIFREILEQDPGHINSLNDMGVLSLHEGKYEDAINFFEKAVKLKPKFANPYYNLACVYSLQKKGDKGMAYLLKAIEVDESVKKWAKEDPDLEYLKGYSEFTAITE